MRRAVAVVCLLLATLLTARSARADLERFRFGVDAGLGIGNDTVGHAFGLAGDVPVGPVSVRLRLEYGHRGYHDGPRNEDDPDEMKSADLWGAHLGVESRTDLASDGSVGGFAGAELGGYRLTGGFLADETTVRAVASGELGVELRSDKARFRIGLGVGASIGRRAAALRDVVDPFAIGRIGIDVAF